MIAVLVTFRLIHWVIYGCSVTVCRYPSCSSFLMYLLLKQVRGQIHLSQGAVLSFGLAHYATSEFELLAEELLMSDSIVKASYMHLSTLQWSFIFYQPNVTLSITAPLQVVFLSLTYSLCYQIFPLFVGILNLLNYIILYMGISPLIS